MAKLIRQDKFGGGIGAPSWYCGACQEFVAGGYLVEAPALCLSCGEKLEF
jgi:hypothetical protein